MKLLKPLTYQDATSQSTAVAVSSSTPVADTVAGAAGSSADAARADHSHPLPHPGTPTCTKGGAVGSGTCTRDSNATDRRGILTAAPSGILSGGTICTITFATAYGATPEVILIGATDLNALGKLSAVAATSISTTGFVLTLLTSALTSGQTYTFTYLVVE